MLIANYDNYIDEYPDCREALKTIDYCLGIQQMRLD